MTEWFRRKSKNIKTFYKKDTTEGSWIKCPNCNEVVYKKVLEDKGIPFNYTDDEISALSNLLGRQGTREYFGYVLRDGRSLADVFP